MAGKINFLRVFALLGLVGMLGSCPVFGAGDKVLPGHVPRVTRRLVATGDVPVTNELRLAIGLPLRDAAGLDKFLAEVADPGSPNFRKYLTPEEFTERFGPTEADYAAVKNFALTNGLNITATHGNRLLLDARGSAANVERAFHLRLQKFRHPTETRDFFAPDAEPTVPAALAVQDVSGLTDYILPHAKIRRRAPAGRRAKAVARQGSEPGTGDFVGGDFRTAYAPGTTLDGTGQMVGLLQFDGFYSNDITAYESYLSGPPHVPVQTVLLDGFNGTPTRGRDSGNSEVSLDIEMAIAMAPGLAKIVVFEAGPSGFQNDILNAMAAASTIKNLSCSWGWSGSQNATTENIFKQMAAQGQSFFNASGDTDAFTPGEVDDPTQANSPSGSPNITQVGGTTLVMNGNGGSYASETVWNAGDGTGSSGGISTANAIPAWQQGIRMTANHGSTTGRNIPDVAMNADNVYVIYGNGNAGTFSGTSCAAPLWAGFMALVNQQAAAAGNPPAGFINPAVYALAQSASYNLCFNDTTAGDNTWFGSPTNFPATPGYDLCTGWGTPAGTNLINALANYKPANSLADTISPTLTITSPVNNQRWSNALFTVTGTAKDNVAVTNVFYSLNGTGWTAATTANHWSNWTANVVLNAGTNIVQAYSEDTSGNKSATNRASLACILSATLTVSTNGRGSISPNYNNAQLQLGANYTLTATAAAGFKFTGWTDANNNVLTNGAVLKFAMQSNLVFTANFMDITRPTLSIATPVGGQKWSNYLCTVSGKAGDNVGVKNVLYSLNGGAWAAAATANGWSNWTASVALVPGTNFIAAVAVDAAGNVSPTNKVAFVFVFALGGRWNTVQFQTPGLMSWNKDDADEGLVGGHDFATATGSLAFNYDGTLSGQFEAPFTGNYTLGSNGVMATTIVTGGATNSFNLFINGSKDSMTLVDADAGQQELVVFKRAPAANTPASLAGSWKIFQFQTPAQMAGDALHSLQGGAGFHATNGSLTLNANGTLSGNLNGAFAGTYQAASNGIVTLTTVAGGGTNFSKLFVNAGLTSMALVAGQLAGADNAQQLDVFERLPASVATSDVAGPWNAVWFQTPAQMTWDATNGLRGGGNFAAAAGVVNLNANGSVTGSLDGALAGSYALSRSGTVSLTMVAGGVTNGFSLFMNAGKDALTGVAGQLTGGNDSQEILLLQRGPAN